MGLALGLSPRELGLSRHVVKPTSVIDWTTTVVAGVESGEGEGEKIAEDSIAGASRGG